MASFDWSVKKVTKEMMCQCSIREAHEVPKSTSKVQVLIV